MSSKQAVFEDMSWKFSQESSKLRVFEDSFVFCDGIIPKICRHIGEIRKLQ